MTEEITYADLEFNKSNALESIPKPAATEEKGLPASSPTWRLAALTFLTLCLALLVGLLALGIVYFQVSNHFQKQIGNLMRNQETLKTNFSKILQDMEDNLCLKGEEKNKNNGPDCILCPANWKWIGGETCFYISEVQMSWEGSQNFCSSQNSTLLMLKDKDKLNYVPPRKDGVYYWIGLHKSNGNSWNWQDGSEVSTQKTDWIHFNGWDTCGLLYGVTISNYYYCKQKLFCICEKAAVKLKYITTERTLARSV